MSPHLLHLALFWVSLAALFFTFAGYLLLMGALCRLRPRPARKATPSPFPTITAVLSVYNEEKRLLARVHNLLDTACPPGALDIVVVSDGSTDASVRLLRELAHPRVRVLERPQRSGKAACLNAGVAAATGDLILFCDARQRFTPETLLELVRNFADPAIGAVSGSIHIEPSQSNVGGGVDLYWRMERVLRHCEGLWDSSVGCTGAVYAIRRRLYRPLPADTILDDVITPMEIARQGSRVIFEPEARAFDPQQTDPDKENIRKRRTLAGNFQMLFRYGSWLLPWGHRLWWQLIAHKYLRLAAPLFLGTLFAANALLAHLPLYRWLFAGQCLFYAAAAAGMLLRRLKLPFISIPAGFVFLNVMTLRGLAYYLRPPTSQGWESVPSHPSKPHKPAS